MPDNQTLTDAQLLAVSQSGDSSLMRKLTQDERARLDILTQHAGKKETTNPSEAYRASLKETAGRTMMGIGQGAIDTVNPVNAVSGLAQGFRIMGGDPMAAMEAGQGMIDTAKGVASGDPDVGGRVVGSLLTGLLLPKGISAATPSAETANSVRGAIGNLLAKQPGIRLGNTPLTMPVNPLAPIGRAMADAADPLGLMSPEASAARARAAHTFPATPTPDRLSAPPTQIAQDPLGLMSPEAIAARERAAHSFPSQPTPEPSRYGGPIRGTTPEVGAQRMANEILDAATTPESGVNLTDWQQKFLQSIGDQVKSGGRISPRQGQVLAELYTSLGLAK